MPASDRPPPPPPARTLAVVRAELAELDRFLAAAPPHAAGPDLATRRARLERELAGLHAAAARTEDRRGDRR